MKVGVIAKYPPIEGGESSTTYWLARGLGERGHKVVIVSNALEVEEDFREDLKTDDLFFLQPSNVTLYFTDPFMRFKPIPASKFYESRLTNLALEADQEMDVDLWYCSYLVPYAIAGFMVSKLTGKPLLVKHAGSDISRLFPNQQYNTLLAKVLREASGIITSLPPQYLGVSPARIYKLRYQINTNIFKPQKREKSLKVVFLGKNSRFKHLRELIRACNMVNMDFDLLLFTNRHEEIKSYLQNFAVKEKVHLRKFVPPWRVPEILGSSHVVVFLEYMFPILIHSPLPPRESICCGSALLTTEEIRRKIYMGALKDGIHLKTIRDPREVEVLSETLEDLLESDELRTQLGTNARKIALQHENFDRYILSFLEICQDVIQK